jgi:hypothetical protein
MSEHFNRYIEGWVKGDVEMILSACAEDFVFDDAIDGRYTKADFPAYFESLREGVLEVTDVVTQETGDLETAWCWYNLKPQEAPPSRHRKAPPWPRRDATACTRRR